MRREELTHHHARADLTFTWDGWMQVMIKTGSTVPGWGVYPDRFDIREPDMWASHLLPPEEQPQFPHGDSVHFVPHTQEAFEDLCNTWWAGREICVGVRDYTRYPWKINARAGRCVMAFGYRYTGGTHIEIAPGGTDDWRPIIDLTAEGRAPGVVSTRWLMGRTDGWENAWLATHGIDVHSYSGHGEPQYEWAMRNLPPAPKNDCAAARFRRWIVPQAAADLAADDWTRLANLGTYRRHVGGHPWSLQLDAADGTRFNFWWKGNPLAYVHSPDLPKPNGAPRTEDECRFVLRSTRKATGDVYEWLTDTAYEWIAAYNAGGPRLPY